MSDVGKIILWSSVALLLVGGAMTTVFVIAKKRGYKGKTYSVKETYANVPSNRIPIQQV